MTRTTKQDLIAARNAKQRDRRSQQSSHSDGIPLFKKHEVLSDEELAALIADYQKTGSIRARNKIVEGNLRLLWLEVKKYVRNPQDPRFGEAYNEAVIGFCYAATKYKLDKGAKFTTYAGWWVRQHVRAFLFRDGPAGNITITQARQLRQEWIEELYDLNPADPKIKVLRDRQNSEAGKKVRYDVAHRIRSAALDEDAVNKTSGSAATHDNPVLGYLESTTEIIDAVEREALLDAVLQDLPERSRTVIGLRFGLAGYTEEALTCAEIGTTGLLGTKITRERVRQLEEEAINRLKALVRKRKLAFDDFM